MNKVVLIALAILFSLLANSSCYFGEPALRSGNGITNNPDNPNNPNNPNNPPKPSVHIGNAIDLGLSVKWADCNVGATSPEDYGSYFSWGETATKTQYNESTYSFKENPLVLPLDHDAAFVNWNNKWRMPTREESEELLEKCVWEYATINGVRGYKVIGPNKNSIFLPFAGYHKCISPNYGDKFVADGSEGRYWTSSNYASSSSSWVNWNARCIFIEYYSGSLSEHKSLWWDRYQGYSVRPVLR